MLPVSLWGLKEYGCTARHWGLVAELRGSRVQAAAKQSVQQAARTSLPNGLQVAAVTEEDKASGCPALCRAA